MENSLTLQQVYIVSTIEYNISFLEENPDMFFELILKLIDENKIAEHDEIMKYIHGLFLSRDFYSYAEEFAKRYNLNFEQPKQLN